MPFSDPIRPAISGLLRNGIGEVSRLGLGNPDIIPLWFGESDLATPPFIREAAKQALDEGRTFYTWAVGLLELREAITRYMARWTGAHIGLDRVTVPGSAMLSIMIALQCVLERGDNVVIITPVWPNIFQAVIAAGGEPRFVPLDPPMETGQWRLDFDTLRAACDARTKAIFVASPGNPTGWVMPAAQQEALLAFAREAGLAILSDEVYGPIMYDRRHAPSFATLARDDDNVFIINSLSKAWAMTGWRIGWLIHPLRLAGPMATLAAVNNTGATTFAQYGAIAAIDKGDDFIAFMVERCRKGRAIVCDFVRQHQRVSWAEPEGAFYGFLNIAGVTDSLAFAKYLVTEAKVGVAPGSAFGPPNGAGTGSFIRICFAQDPGRLCEALERIAGGIDAYHPR
ncbi:MAG: pyridoxal phosphate-dependent aminotransferase [Alphaproteobacteria bacterium]|nr:pyridoxal phosphate-dependent aminotransferase [Alphaproteobacteria bacterium]